MLKTLNIKRILITVVAVVLSIIVGIVLYLMVRDYKINHMIIDGGTNDPLPLPPATEATWAAIKGANQC
jgi:hypothetical protein